MVAACDPHKVAKLKMRGRQCLCASFLFFVCLAYYIMAYGQTTANAMAMMSGDNLEAIIAADTGNQSDSPYVIDKPTLCGDANRTLTLLIMVVTAPNNTDARAAIRNTWGNVARNTDVRMVFVLGSSMDNDTQSRLLAEDSMYNDLVQGRFTDAYYNLTRKSVFIVKWANTRCANARYVLKIDDDCFLHSANLLKFLSGRKETSAIFGRLWKKVKPIRDEKHKWAVSKEVFSGEVFPEYTGGPSYVITSGAAIQSLLKVIQSGKAPWLDLEDVYLTGLCAEKANVKRINDNKFNNEDFANVCGAREVITYHRISPDLQYLLWWVTNDGRWQKHCSSKDTHKSLAEMANVITVNLHS